MISSFFKKRKSPPILTTDLHSHLIPNIDDGSKSLEESLLLLEKMQKLGYKKIITTPHVMADSYKNTPKIINDGLSKLLVASRLKGIDIQIEAAAEYYLDDGFEELVKSNNILIIKGKYLLFETSYFAKPMHFEKMIFTMKSFGYIPLMAHPERYRYVKDPKKEYGLFKELGIMFQVNLNSFGGHYGIDAKRKADFLSKAGMIDFLGSDVHSIKQLNTLANVFKSKEYRDIFINNHILNNELI